MITGKRLFDKSIITHAISENCLNCTKCHPKNNPNEARREKYPELWTWGRINKLSKEELDQKFLSYDFDFVSDYCELTGIRGFDSLSDSWKKFFIWKVFVQPIQQKRSLEDSKKSFDLRMLALREYNPSKDEIQFNKVDAMNGLYGEWKIKRGDQ